MSQLFQYNFNEYGAFADQVSIFQWMLNGGVVTDRIPNTQSSQTPKVFFMGEDRNVNEVSFEDRSAVRLSKKKSLSREDFHYPNNYRPFIECVKIQSEGFTLKVEPKDLISDEEPYIRIRLPKDMHAEEIKALKQMAEIGCSVTLWR